MKKSKRNLLLSIAIMFVSAFTINAKELPNVLLIGDSISIHYTKPTQELLKGKANVLHHPGSALRPKQHLTLILSRDSIRGQGACEKSVETLNAEKAQ